MQQPMLAFACLVVSDLGFSTYVARQQPSPPFFPILSIQRTSNQLTLAHVDLGRNGGTKKSVCMLKALLANGVNDEGLLRKV